MPIKVVMTANLQPIFPEREVLVEATNLSEVFASLEAMRPNFRSYIFEDNGEVRKHVNIFVDNEMVGKKLLPEQLNQTLNAETTIHIMQALSGG